VFFSPSPLFAISVSVPSKCCSFQDRFTQQGQALNIGVSAAHRSEDLKPQKPRLGMETELVYYFGTFSAVWPISCNASCDEPAHDGAIRVIRHVAELCLLRFMFAYDVFALL